MYICAYTHRCGLTYTYRYHRAVKKQRDTDKDPSLLVKSTRN